MFVMDLLISRSLPAHWTIIPIDGNSRFVSPSLCEQIKRFNYVKSSDDPLVFARFQEFHPHLVSPTALKYKVGRP